jgi:hypothetical protein
VNTVIEEGTEISLSFGNRGRVGVTGFCPFCQSQVFGSLVDAATEDLLAHLDEFHPCSYKGKA